MLQVGHREYRQNRKTPQPANSISFYNSVHNPDYKEPNSGFLCLSSASTPKQTNINAIISLIKAKYLVEQKTKMTQNFHI